MSRWRPSPDEERWLETASVLRGVLARGALDERAGRWRTIGLTGRIALFVLGLVAAALVFGIVSLLFASAALLLAGLITLAAAEWLKLERRLHAAGVEEALCAAGYLLVATWLADKVTPVFQQSGDLLLVVITVAGGAAGLRLLNPFLTTCAAIALLAWCETTTLARTLDPTIGPGATGFVLAMLGATLALVLGRRRFERPSYDRMLDWLVVGLPLYAYGVQLDWNPLAGAPFAHAITGWRAARMLVLLVFATTALVVALRRRRHAPLLAALGGMTCVALECTRAVSLPAEAWLLSFGVVAILVAAVLDRYLRTPRQGITSARLTGHAETLDVPQSAGAAVLSARTGPVAPVEPDYAGQGGRFGGGGASGSF